ncbi:MAG: hypothetical protein APF76_08140 [Desulfitibacter sp. BRH_c19]|nr:MAG: hypothetical protein APF76_08140 [Desulfitibacter sp. BRH_c19]
MRNFSHRLSTLLIILLISFTLLLIRLVYIQVINGDDLRQRAFDVQNKYLNAEEIPRADIVDRTGISLLGNQVETREVMITNDRGIFISDNKEELVQVADLAENQFFYLPVTTRYGNESLARHLIGHLVEGRGANGLERIYDDYLISSSKYLWKIVLDGRGNVVQGLSFQREERDVARNKLILTLDREIQEIVELVMENHGVSGSVVVMDPENGDLLAIASRPNYDQNNLLDHIDETNLLNKAFQHYFPGSLFKTFIAAAALEEGVVKTTDQFLCTGAYVFPTGLSISCWKSKGHGHLNLIEGMAYSCNPTFIDVGLRLGRENIIKYAERLKLTDNTVMGYPQNTINRIDIDYGPGKIANASLGQEGVMLTPVQMGVLISSIANGGYAVTPRVVKGIKDNNDNLVEEVIPIPPYKIWSDDTVAALQEMLYAVNRWGTGTNAWSNNYPSAGKTASAETGSGVNALFSGYYPVDNPKYVVIVIVEGGRSGGGDAAPIFKDILETIG